MNVRLLLRNTLAIIFPILLNILLFRQLNLYPSHDSLQFTQRLYSITQALRSDRSLITYHPNIRFGIISSAFDTVSIESLPSLFVSSILNLSPSSLFYSYYLTSSFVLGFAWLKLFQWIEISRRTQTFGLFILGTVNYPLWQIWFNYQLFFQVTFLLLAIVSLKNHHPRRWFIFFSMNLLFIPLGHPFYFSIFIYYLEIFVLILISKDIVPFNDFFSEAKRLSTIGVALIYFPILCYVVTKNANILRTEAAVLSPGSRNANGTATFTDFLFYGGSSGPLKLLSILGIQTPESLDFTLFTSMTALPLLYLNFISKIQKNKRSFYLPNVAIISGVLIATYPVKILAHGLYFLPGMDYLRHLSYFSSTIKPFVFLMMIQTIDQLNLTRLKQLCVLCALISVFLFHEKRQVLSLVFLILFIAVYLFTSRSKNNKKKKNNKREIRARELLMLIMIISNMAIFFQSNSIKYSRLPLVELYSNSQEFKLDKEASDNLTSSYLALAKSSTMTTYDSLALQLKRIYCIDLMSIKDAKNAPIRSDLESKSLRLERTKYEEICKLGGARFWQWDGESLTPATARFRLSVYPEITRLNYEILNFKPNSEYFVELSQTRWSIRDAHSKKLQNISSGETCKSCVSFQLKSNKGTIDVVTREVWRMVQLIFLFVATAYFLFTVKVIFTGSMQVRSAPRSSTKKHG